MDKCPTCCSRDAVIRNFGITGWSRCNECGTMWWPPSGNILVPRRAQPPEVKELPDSVGWWWWWQPQEGSYRPVLVSGGCYDPSTPGEYVKAEEPPPPPPPQRSDADILREAAEWLFKLNRELSGELRRIAAERSEHEDND